jgi:hypothetical protein
MTVNPQEEIKIHQVPERLLSSACPTPHVNSLDTYRQLWQESVDHPEKFFGDVSCCYCCLPLLISSSLFILSHVM